MARASRWPWVATILLYAAAALEMFIMVTRFAAYFYSVYTPLFHGLEQSAATAWLPHLAHTKLARVPIIGLTADQFYPGFARIRF